MLKMVIRMDENKIIIEKKYKLEGIYSTKPVDLKLPEDGLLME